MRKTYKIMFQIFLLVTVALIISFVALQPTQAAPQAAYQLKYVPVTFRKYISQNNYCIANKNNRVRLWLCGQDPYVTVPAGETPASQQWELIPRARTQANIRSVYDGKCMQQNAATGEITMAACVFDASAQCWEINYEDSVNLPTLYSRVPRPGVTPCGNPNKSMQPDKAAAGYPSGAPVNLFPNLTTQFTVWQIDPINNITNVQIRSAWSYKCLTVGSKVYQEDCSTTGNVKQLFTFGETGTIKSQSANKLLRYDGFSGGNGTKITLCPTSSERSWYFHPIGGYFQIATSKCMDLDNNYPPSQNFIEAQVWDCYGAYQSNQIWYLRQVVIP